LNPELADAYNNRGIAYAGKGELDRAIEDYNTAIKLNPELADAYYNRGIAYRDKGELDRAIEDYKPIAIEVLLTVVKTSWIGLSKTMTLL
jgi:tetratricopeptide (TPR) repeat protein